MKTIAKLVRKAIMKIPKDILFTYKDFPIPQGKAGAVTQTIYRMLRAGEIKRYKKGHFYKPEKGYTGEDQLLSANTILKTYLVKNGHKIGYITGIQTYNTLGLTTQYPFVVQIASHLPFANLGQQGDRIRIKRVKSYVSVTDENWQMLQFLDLFRYFTVLYLDLNRARVIQYFINRLKKMNSKERKEIVALALSYPPRIRAFLGALLEQGGMKKRLAKLKHSLSPMSFYRLHADRYDLPTAQKWHLYDDLTRKQTFI